ncbi:MAG: lysine--tRNA ligase [Phycisphaerae bacterium]|nr:lysine--tRNA ligase [Phycisphaerae bacterium]
MLEKVQEDRLAKLEAIRTLGIDPCGPCAPYAAERIDAILARYQEVDGQPAPDQRADAAGRIILLRDMGKMMFAHIRDESHPKGIQICLRKDQPEKPPAGLGETQWKLAKLLDLGDIVAARGLLHKTRTGEITIFADNLELMVKSQLPMPEKWHGLSDVQTRYRQRYLDLMTNPDSLAVFQKRIKIIETFRELLKARGFSEVETPTLQSIYGGAAARPFTTHHNALDIDLFMRISPELYLKRLLVGGMERVYEFAKVFRNEGIDTRHNPEFTLMELYQAYADYNVMMEITEELVTESAQRVSGSERLAYGEREINFSRPWSRRKYRDLVLEHAGVDWKDDAAVRAKARALRLDEANKDLAVVVNDIFEAVVEPALAALDHPTFVLDYPAEICPLTRRDPADPSVAFRFECFVAGMEIANAYTELNDPAVQEANFREQVRGEAAGETMRVMDEDFVTALRHGMPPAGGLGIGIDRIIMLLTNTTSIRDVVLFPLLRPEA